MAFPLTENQLKIVNHVDGPLLVIAGPGSGKTRVLTERIISLLNLKKKRILALTFSNKAAEEISERIEMNTTEDVYEDVFIGTIHSFCLDVVMNKGNLIGLPPGMVLFESEADKIEILKKVFAELPELKSKITDMSQKGNFLKNCLAQISQYKQQFISPELLMDSNSEKDTNFFKVYEAYNNMMLAQRVLDFDDILFYAYRIFTERPQIATNYTRLYKYIFVDEAQDLNAGQYKIIKSLCISFSNIMMVGDPDQSIYGFNGSDSKYMTTLYKEDFNPVMYKLIENFRSTKKIIEAAKSIQQTSDSTAVFPLDGELLIQPFKNEDSEAEWVVNQIGKLLKYGNKWVDNLKFEDIAIIARNRYVLSKVHEKLEDKNIPYNYGTASRSVESESVAIKIFEAGIRIIINPFDNVHFNQILSLLKIKIEPNYMTDQFNYLDMLYSLNEGEIEEDYLNYLEPIKEAWKVLKDDEESFSKALKVISEKLVLTKMNNKDEMLENEQYLIQKDIEMWSDHWKKYCSSSVTGQRSLTHFRNQVSLGRTQKHNNSGVSLLTVHMSKGLEYDVTFLIGLNEGTFPDYRAKSNTEYKEELNNMFVALTRARRICYLSYPQYKLMPWGNMKFQSPSRFINMIEKN